MANFIRIGDEILNLDNVLRIERGTANGQRPTVMIYFVGGEHAHTQYTDDQAAAVWERFSGMSREWDVPDPIHTAPAGAGRVAQQT